MYNVYNPIIHVENGRLRSKTCHQYKSKLLSMPQKLHYHLHARMVSFDCLGESTAYNTNIRPKAPQKEASYDFLTGA